MNAKRALQQNHKQEQRWHGLGVSDGIATGRVLRIHSGARPIYRQTLAPADIEPEIERFKVATEQAHQQLLVIKERAAQQLGIRQAYIFDAHLLMLEDRKLLDDVCDSIKRQRVNAEWAIKVVTDRLLTIYAEIKDDYLRERGSDIEDVTYRILTALAGGQTSRATFTEDVVVVAEELLPSTTVELDFTRVQAVASDVGGWTSHTAIITRSLGIPAVVGLRDLYRTARTGDSIAVDATGGEIVLHPSAGTKQIFARRIASGVAAGAASAAAAAAQPSTQAAAEARRVVRTLDGVEVTLRANVELPAEYAGVNRYGARGIGLYRSEFLLAQYNRMPTEEEQYEAYTEVARVAGADGVTIRLFDLGADKMKLSDADAERNPALGLRAIRLSLQQPNVLRTQVRALLRVQTTAPLRIVLPMISDVTEVRRAKTIIEEERARLTSGQAGDARVVADVKIGAMIEVPSAVLIADRLADEVDFFSIGTNDLVQYLLAVDRGNDAVAEWFRSLHPAVLQSIQMTIEAARRAMIPVVVCGEMAATPVYAFVLTGLGGAEFSMTASSIPRVRRMIEQIEYTAAHDIVRECLACASADDVEELVRQRLGQGWPRLFPPDTLPAAKSQG